MWKDLSLRDKAAFMKVAINNGIYDLKDIQEHYNKYAEGGYYDNKTIEVTLPEIVVTPSEVQKEYKLKVRPFLDKKAALDIGKSFDLLPKLYFDSRMKAFIDIHEYAGKPHLKGILNPILPITTDSGKPRAYYNPVFNTAYNINSLRDAMEEMSHPILLKLSKKPTAEIFDYVKDVVTGKLLESYNKKGSLEYNTHRIVLPLLNKYLLQKYRKGNHNIGTLEDLLTLGYNKFDEGGYVRELNNHPVAFDEEGNLTDLVTGEKGTMMLPNFNVYGSKEVADRVALRRLNNLINHSEINPFTGETRVIGLESTYPEFELLGFKDLVSPIFNSIKKGVTYSAAKLGNKLAQSKIIADMLDNSTLNNTLLTPISSKLITYTPNTSAPSSNTFTGFNDMRAYSEFVNRLDRDYAKAYLEGDIETGLRMWDNWFKYRTPNNKAIDALGNPIKTYHTVGDLYDPSFTVFDTGIEGRPTAIYSTDNPIMSASYSHKPVDEVTLNAQLDDVVKMYNAIIRNRKRDFKTDYLKAKESNFEDDFFTGRIDKDIYIEDLQNLKTQRENALNRVKNRYSPQRRKELYLNLENPLEIEGYGYSWKNIPVVLGEGIENLSLSKNIPKVREFVNKYGIYFDDPNDILYLDKYSIEDEFLHKLGREFSITNPHMDNIDNYPKAMLNKMKEFYKTLNTIIPSRERMSTRDIESLIRYLDGTNFDSAIIRDIGDWGGAAKPKLMFNEETGGYNTGTVFESLKPSQLKSTAPFTFDDKGNLIPLSRRANFNNPDMRYSLLPVGLTIGGATYLNQRNKNK